MPNPNAPKDINDLENKDKPNNPDELEISEPAQSMIDTLRQRTGKSLGATKREGAEETFALMQAEKLDLQAKTPEEILMAKESLKRNGDIRMN